MMDDCEQNEGMVWGFYCSDFDDALSTAFFNMFSLF